MTEKRMNRRIHCNESGYIFGGWELELRYRTTDQGEIIITTTRIGSKAVATTNDQGEVIVRGVAWEKLDRHLSLP